ncbi:MAG: hypothetical protein IJT44_08370 [Clostridia bacterium]|nr:hypothetical protein [Clostridia bacterium]
MKKIISVLLCVALMFTFLTVISFAADGDATGEETIWGMFSYLLEHADWGAILQIFVATIQTFLRMIGQGA